MNKKKVPSSISECISCGPFKALDFGPAGFSVKIFFGIRGGKEGTEESPGRGNERGAGEDDENNRGRRLLEFAASLDLAPPVQNLIQLSSSALLSTLQRGDEPLVAVKAGLVSGMRSDARSSFLRKCVFEVDIFSSKKDRANEKKKKRE